MNGTRNSPFKLLVVVATYDELQNLPRVTGAILEQEPLAEILVVDDNSPDGTGVLAADMSRRDKRIHVVHRKAKTGLASALWEALCWASQRGYDFIINMDADLSHDPKQIASLVGAAEAIEQGEGTLAVTYDLVIGSRFYGGIRVLNWGPRRLFLSLAAARYVKFLTGLPIADPTSGFRCFSGRALRLLLERPLISQGYSFHIETLYNLWQNGLRIKEVPIIYTERIFGHTKLNRSIIIEAILVTIRLRLRNLALSRSASRVAEKSVREPCFKL